MVRKMIGIKRAAGATKRCRKDGRGIVFQINYDPEADIVWFDECSSSGSYFPYPEHIISFHTAFPITMKKIRERINEVAEYRNQFRETV